MRRPLIANFIIQGDVKKEMMLMADKLDKIEKALHIQPTPVQTG